MQFNQSAIFFVVQIILIIGMHNFFNMQIKSFKTWKKKRTKVWLWKNSNPRVEYQTTAFQIFTLLIWCNLLFVTNVFYDTLYGTQNA